MRARDSAPVVLIVGLPGVGKSRVALELGARLVAEGAPFFVLHTDLLKVTARLCGVDGLRGASHTGDWARRRAAARPLLAGQIDKARRDGYGLIVEGSLALACVDFDAFIVHLTLAEELRRARCARKHPSAAAALADAALEGQRALLAAIPRAGTLELDAATPVAGIVERITRGMGERWPDAVRSRSGG